MSWYLRYVQQIRFCLKLCVAEKFDYLQTQKIVEGRRSWRLGIYKARIYENVWEGVQKKAQKCAIFHEIGFQQRTLASTFELLFSFCSHCILLVWLLPIPPMGRWKPSFPSSLWKFSFSVRLSWICRRKLPPVKVFSVYWGCLGFVEESSHLWNRSMVGSTPSRSPPPSHDNHRIEMGLRFSVLHICKHTISYWLTQIVFCVITLIDTFDSCYATVAAVWYINRNAHKFKISKP